MAGLDEISEAIGGLRSDVRHGLEKLDHLHACLHAQGGAFARIAAIERGRAYDKGKAAGLGALGGASFTIAWKALAAKLGFGG